MLLKLLSLTAFTRQHEYLSMFHRRETDCQLFESELFKRADGRRSSPLKALKYVIIPIFRISKESAQPEKKSHSLA